MSNLAELRRDRGWTQQELAYRADVAPRSVQGWENGSTPRPIYQERLAKVLKVKVAELGFGG
jgi:transcriptional regulator with XRE-family HTH domain